MRSNKVTVKRSKISEIEVTCKCVPEDRMVFEDDGFNHADGIHDGVFTIYENGKRSQIVVTTDTVRDLIDNLKQWCDSVSGEAA